MNERRARILVVALYIVAVAMVTYLLLMDLQWCVEQYGLQTKTLYCLHQENAIYGDLVGR